MDFLKNIAIPQSTEHFHVLIVIAGLISIVLYPYLGFLLGSSVLSFIFNRKGTREGRRDLVRFAKDLIDTALLNKTVPTFLALIPSFSLVFVYAQLLQSTDAMSVGLAGYGFLLLLVAIVLLYTYKYTFRLSGILAGYEDLLRTRPKTSNGSEEIEQYARQTSESHYKTGRWGIILLACAAFLIVSSVPVITNPSNWTDLSTVFDLLLSPDVLVKVLQFIAGAAGATGVGILYFFFSWQGGKKGVEGEQALFVRRLALKLTISSLLAQPVLILLNVYLLPGVSLSGWLYGFVGLALVLLFLTAQFVYAYAQDAQVRHVNSAFYLLLSTFVFLSVNDQVAVHNATAVQASFLAYRFDQATEELKTKLGVAAVALTGEDIYNGRCSACHLFDQKKIGPAYKDVVPTFHGDRAKMLAFVLNPVKVDPAYPPMPNQGLRPAEADSIVSYILRRLAAGENRATSQAQPAPQK